MSRAYRLLLLLALLAGLTFVWLRWLPHGSSRQLAPPPPPKPDSSHRGLIDQQTATRLEALEAERRQVEQTTWAPEIESQRYEAVFNQLWDELRRSSDPFAVLADFPFGTLEIGTAGPPQTLDDGIQLQHTSGPARRLAPSEWRRMLQEWRAAGWSLDGSEWRHVQFDPATNGGARSVFTMELHALQREPPRRAIIRGRLGIEWTPPAGERGGIPLPRRIDATELSIYRREGPPLFELVARDVVPPERNSIFIDPLMLYDLDGDGRDEVVLGCKNRMYWNKGGGVFQGMRLCPQLDTVLSTATLGDFDGDGHVDFLGADNDGLVLFLGDVAGGFTGSPRHQPLKDLLNPYVFTSGDVDGDGDLDVWLSQYKVPLRFGQMPTPYFDANDGFPSYLLLNDGHGYFQDATAESGLAPRRFRRTYSASFCDLDGDGDLDLVNVSDFAGVDLHLNDGHGRFRDVTDVALPERHLFGMAHAILDFNGDGRPDLFAVGMNSPSASRLDHLKLGPSDRPENAAMRAVMSYGNRTFLNRGDRFEPAPFAQQISSAGWAWGVTALDVDNDGDLDLYLANGHRSQQSVKEYDPQFWMHDIYVAGSQTNSLLEVYFDSKTSRSFGAGESYGGHQRNVFFLNAGTAGWHDVAWLLGVAMPEDCHAVASDDLDGDGRADLLVLTEEYWPERRNALFIYRNQSPATNWVSVRVTAGPGLVIGEPTEVALHLASGSRQHRWLLTGDGYRTQAPPVAHFGLGRDERIDRVEVKQRGKIASSITHPKPRQILRTGAQP